MHTNNRKLSEDFKPRSTSNRNSVNDISNISDVFINPETPNYDDVLELYEDVLCKNSKSVTLMTNDNFTQLTDRISVFIRQCFIMNSLSHPCIPRAEKFQLVNKSIGGIVYQHGYIPLSDLIKYIGMGLLKSPLFLRRHYTKLGYLKCSVVYKIITRIFHTLEYLHSCNIIHADIKPDNIMVNANTLDIYLVEYGLSVIYFGEISKKVQSKKYRAPEVEYGMITPKIDMWSVGCILYEMLSGRPFNSTSMIESLTKGGRLSMKDSGSQSKKYIVSKLPISPKRLIDEDRRYGELLNVLYGCLTTLYSQRLSASSAVIILRREYFFDIGKGLSSPFIEKLTSLDIENGKENSVAEFLIRIFVKNNPKINLNDDETEALNNAAYLLALSLCSSEVHDFIDTLTDSGYYELTLEFVRLFLLQTQFFKNTL